MTSESGCSSRNFFRNNEMTDLMWTSNIAKILVELIIEQVQRGRKELEWGFICDEFCSRSKLMWDEEQLKHQYAVMRKQYLIVKSIFDRDDFSWHESTGIIVATVATDDARFIEEENLYLTYEDLCRIFSNSDGGQETSQPTKPNSSNSRKRGRKSGDDATYTMAGKKSGEDATYTIADCIKRLDEIAKMHGLEEDIYFGALVLFKEPNVRETFLSLKVM
ncbi:uncharacterized protein LOC111014759 isoform X2 [Momordica charantia]|uniref:Uncharacterized protein LOC111014759 isoform X2 n=1 Tax=Momordica charantia TaxID=3673 RepID=A0A6J1CTZ5_MOMCH|nr:uncharacterized protein LOC111014759 isoform X2 [Momordica charantia]